MKVGVMVKKRGRQPSAGPKRRVIKKGMLTHLPTVSNERGAGCSTPTSKVSQVYWCIVCACYWLGLLTDPPHHRPLAVEVMKLATGIPQPRRTNPFQL